MDELKAQLGMVRRRVRMAMAARWGLAGLSAGLLAAALAIGIGGRYWPLLWQVSPWALSAGLAGVCAALAAVASRLVPLDQFTIARVVESHASLKDRVSSAVWAVAKGGEQVDALACDAAASLREVQLRRSIRVVRWPYLKLPSAALAVLAVVILLPSAAVLNSPARKQQQMALKQQGAGLQKVASKVARDTRVDVRLRERLSKQLAELGAQLKSGRLSNEQARVKLSKMDERLMTQAEQMARSNSLQNAWKVPGEFEKARDQMAADAAERMKQEKLSGKPAGLKDAASAGTGKLPAMEAKKAASPGQTIPPDIAKRLAELYGKKDFQEAARLMEELRKKLALKPDAAEQKQLAQDLEALAKALNEADLEALAKQMLEAAKALSAMDPEKARELLSKACDNCRKLGIGMGGMCALQSGAEACRSGGYNQYGSTDSESRDGKGIGNPSDAPRVHGANRLDKEWARLYDPRRTEVKTKSVKAPSQIGEKGAVTRLEVEGAPDPNANSNVPYYDIYPEYRKAAEKALSREDIPVSERKRVRDYFDALR